MATALPRPSRPSNGPPNIALPALPVAKTRKSTGGLATPSRSLSGTPKSGLRAPSAAYSTPSTPAPTSSLPHPRVASGINPAGKSIRKVVSINSFPQPPSRASSVPPSPLAESARGSARRSKASTASTYSHVGGSTPSLLNGSGEGKSVGVGLRMSDGLISVASPPQSRSSSAQDSYSTSATTYDDPLEASTAPGGAVADKRASKQDGKGNVIVSVRVRPDLTGNDNPKDWEVDPKKALISHHGRESGDYCYGKLPKLGRKLFSQQAFIHLESADKYPIR